MRASVIVRIGPLAEDDLEVAAFHGDEALSRLSRFDVTLRSATDLLALQPTLLGTPATLAMTTEGEAPAVVHGILTALSGDGSAYNQRRQFVARIEPRMALLRRRRNSRIFQDVSVVTIVSRILDEHGLAYTWSLSKSYPQHAYSVQYQETDWELVTRLCSEEGIFFHFIPPDAAAVEQGAAPDALSEVVAFCDSAQHYLPMAAAGAIQGVAEVPVPAVPFRSTGGAAEGRENIRAFSYRRSLRPQVVALRDYDFERPRLDLNVDVATDGVTVARPALFAEGLAAAHQPLEMYEHHAEYDETDVSQGHAERMLEARRARAMLAKGESSCRRFSAGRRFLLEGHPQEELDGQEYALVRVVHTYAEPGAGATDAREVYSNRFECVPAQVPYRPRKKRRSLAQVLESAEVVGPAGEQIHTDKYGRIKVQFHWDRHGSKTDSSSCWIRVSQAWAGNSWGSQFIPRVGMEVLVSFLGGDEDRPVVLGTVYNATHPPPFSLPLGKTKSGFRSQSLAGPSASSNELSFEDGAGAELVYLHAQRDLRESAGNDHHVNVSHDQRTVVAQSQRITVGGERNVSVGGDESHAVSGTSSGVVGGDRRVSIGGSSQESVAGSVSRDLHGLRVHNHGSEKHIVEGFVSMTVGTEERATGLDVVVHGNENHDAGKSIRLHAETRISFECGDSSVTLLPDAVRIDAKRIVINAKEKLILLGDGPAIELGKEADILADAIKMFSKGGSIELDDEAAHVDGPLVKLNCGAGDAPEIKDETEDPKTKLFQWRCLDSNLEPYSGKTFRLVMQGFRKKGVTDEDGVIEEDIPIDAMMADLILWVDEYPAGERIHSTIRLEKQPPASSLLGAACRLTNLGYYFGPDTDELTAELSGALREFQHDHGLAESGELDAETVDKLDEVHPS